eukprot:m.336200 g.336200  ORF g.336200 m.336200 type:complete len:309 (+) comp20532_c2_seq1:1540-2466(+)
MGIYDPATATGERSAALCPTLLAKWRDCCRDWPANLYAYAIPSKSVSARISSLGGAVVEIGAGTGYWARYLHNHKTKVRAFDVAPTQQTPGMQLQSAGKLKSVKKKKGRAQSTAAMNEYHGNVPSFFTVARGDHRVLSRREHPSSATETLLLCYPPPLVDMAQVCLRAFSGKYVVYVGEFRGFTGTTAFEQELGRDFELESEHKVPNFPNQSCTVSLWRRRTQHLMRSGTGGQRIEAVLRCSGCKLQHRQLFRCRYCREACYCSDACMVGHRAVHEAWHVMRHIFCEGHDGLQALCDSNSFTALKNLC